MRQEVGNRLEILQGWRNDQQINGNLKNSEKMLIEDGMLIEVTLVI